MYQIKLYIYFNENQYKIQDKICEIKSEEGKISIYLTKRERRVKKSKGNKKWIELSTKYIYVYDLLNCEIGFELNCCYTRQFFLFNMY